MFIRSRRYLILLTCLCFFLSAFLGGCTEKTETQTDTVQEDSEYKEKITSAESEKQDDNEAVRKVTGLTAKPGDYSVSLKWNTIEGADGYCIYKSTDNEEYKPFKYSSHDGKAFSGLENGVDYYFTVAAYKIIDKQEVYGEMSDPVKVTPVNDVLTMSESYIVLESEGEHELYCRLYDEKQNAVWSSSDESVALVSQNGLVTAVGTGKATITAALNGETTECTAEVDRGYPAMDTNADPRFIKGTDGIWSNGGTSNKATLLFTGDLMALEKQMQDADTGDHFNYDFYPSFANVRDVLAQGDLVIGNLETTLTEKFPYSNDLNKYMKVSNCNTSPCYLNALRDAGFDMLVTANNHYCDAGLDGITDTIDRLDEYNFMHTGTYKSAEDERFVIANVNGIKVAVINYNQKSTNGKDSMLTEKQQKEMLGKFYRSRVPENIAAAKEKGAEFIVVFMHFGTQNTVAVNETQDSIAQYVADEGADLIVCSHPHILQKFDYVTASDGRTVPCAYSLGNFYSSMAELETNKYNMIFHVGIEKTEDKVEISDISYTPCSILPKYGDRKYVITPTDFLSDALTDDNKFELLAAHKSIVKTVGNLIPPECEP